MRKIQYTWALLIVIWVAMLFIHMGVPSSSKAYWGVTIGLICVVTSSVMLVLSLYYTYRTRCGGADTQGAGMAALSGISFIISVIMAYQQKAFFMMQV